MVIINIDTSKDSPEEIKKTIKYLQTLVGDEQSTSSSVSQASPGLFGMFDDSAMSEQTGDATEPTSRVTNEEASDTIDINKLLNEKSDDDAEKSADKEDSNTEDTTDDTAEVVTDDDDVYIEIVDY